MMRGPEIPAEQYHIADADADAWRVSGIARAEKLDRTYVGDVPRLTLLAPEIVEAILDGRQPDGVTLPVVMKPFPTTWKLHSWPVGD